MNLFSRLRNHLFPLDEIDHRDRDRISARADEYATEQAQRAIELMSHWDKERAEDLRRINRTGNFAEGWLVPEARKGPK